MHHAHALPSQQTVGVNKPLPASTRARRDEFETSHVVVRALETESTARRVFVVVVAHRRLRARLGAVSRRRRHLPHRARSRDDGRRERERDGETRGRSRSIARGVVRHDATRRDSTRARSSLALPSSSSRASASVCAPIWGFYVCLLPSVCSNMGFLCMSPPECVLQYGFLLYVSSDGRTRPTGGGRRRRRESATRRDETGRDGARERARVHGGARDEARRGDAGRDGARERARTTWVKCVTTIDRSID